MSKNIRLVNNETGFQLEKTVKLTPKKRRKLTP